MFCGLTEDILKLSSHVYFWLEKVYLCFAANDDCSFRMENFLKSFQLSCQGALKSTWDSQSTCSVETSYYLCFSVLSSKRGDLK